MEFNIYRIYFWLYYGILVLDVWKYVKIYLEKGIIDL